MNPFTQFCKTPQEGGSAHRKASTNKDNTTQKNAIIHLCLERYSNPQSQCSNSPWPYAP